MKIRNNKKVIIITIVAIVLVLLIGGAYAFLATDLFKSNKDLFFEYAAQIFSENGFIDGKLEQYNSKKNNRTYENEGTITFNVDSEKMNSDLVENINNMSISFAGNNDEKNKKAEAVFKINYTDDINFPIYYKKIDDVEGLKLTDISKTTYFSIKDGELGKFISKATGNNDESEKISFEPLKLDLSNMKLSKDEQKKLKETYLKIIDNNIDGSNITKIDKDNLNGYTLSIGNKELKQIINKVLETLSNDGLMLNRLSRITGLDVNSESIKNIMTLLDLIDMENGSTNITLYGKNKELRRIEIEFKDELSIKISKDVSEDENKYVIEFENLNMLFNLNIKYQGLKELNNVNENYDINLEINDNQSNDYSSFTYNIENKIRFNEDIDIKEFKEKEYIDLNAYERLPKLLQTIGKKIENSNKEKLKKAKIDGENPVLAIVPGLKEYISKFIPLENKQEKKQENEQNENQSEKSNENQEQNQNSNQNENENQNQNENQQQEQNQSNQESSIINGMEKLEKDSFNARIKQYEGQNVKGPTVKSLFMQIIATNMAMEDHQIQAVGDIELNGDQVPDTIVSSKMYTVKCFVGEDGYINKVEVKEKAATTTNQTTTNTTANTTTNN